MNEVQELIQELKMLSKIQNIKLNMLVGVDGFVDEILHVVEKRHNFNSFTRMKTISSFGERIIRASGLSTNIEFVPQQTKLGGNGPILANALLEFGVNLTYIGALGKTSIHPVFSSMAEKCNHVYSLCEPGFTDALEFEDGKLLLGKITTLQEITWQRFKEAVGPVQKIADIIKESQLISIVNWTMVPKLSEIWEGLIAEVFPLLPDNHDKPLAFFDLCDPEKRTKNDILHAMGLLGKFNEKFRAVLGLNEKELYEIAAVFDIQAPGSSARDEKLKYLTEEVYKVLGIYCLVVHPVKEAFAYSQGEFVYTDGLYCAKPLLTTGAGDNFNAGFCYAQALGLSLQLSLKMGVAASGYYVRNARSATMDELITFLDNWAKNGE